jgi:integrase
LGTIRMRKEDWPKPMPYSDTEIGRLLAQVPVTFPDTRRAAKIATMIRLMVSTGLAIVDAAKLERDSISADGWLTISRTKTGKPVRQPLEAGLLAELRATLNSNPRYVFWPGRGTLHTMIVHLQRDVRRVMEACGLYVRQGGFHRFRDTAALFWKRNGCTPTQVATMLGDTEQVVMKHYWPEGLEDDQLLKIPQRKW